MHPRAALLALCLSAACGPSSSSGDLGGRPDGGRCTPGEAQPCICLGGAQGTQSCRANGSSYGSCLGCGAEESDGPLPVVRDMGGNPCGDCDGCCDGAVCVPFAQESNTRCGGRGQSCAACGTNRLCDASTGLCVDASGGCNPSSCATGCCKDVGGQPTCFIHQPSACGKSGAACAPCTIGVTCDGACTNQLDPGQQLKVIVTRATFYNTDVGGNCWDNYAGFGCAQPDPHVCVGYQSGQTLLEGCTTVKDDVPAGAGGIDDVTWSAAEGLITSGGQPFLVPGSLFIQGGKVRVTLYDIDDFNSDDEIALTYLAPITTYQDPYTLSAFGRSTSISFQLR